MNYPSIAATAAKMLAQYGAALSCERVSASNYDPDISQNTEIKEIFLVAGLFDGYSSREIDGNNIQQGDCKIYLGATSGYVPIPGDRVTIGSDAWTLISVGQTAPAGVAVIYECQGRK